MLSPSFCTGRLPTPYVKMFTELYGSLYLMEGLVETRQKRPRDTLRTISVDNAA